MTNLGSICDLILDFSHFLYNLGIGLWKVICRKPPVNHWPAEGSGSPSGQEWESGSSFSKLSALSHSCIWRPEPAGPCGSHSSPVTRALREDGCCFGRGASVQRARRVSDNESPSEFSPGTAFYMFCVTWAAKAWNSVSLSD